MNDWNSDTGPTGKGKVREVDVRNIQGPIFLTEDGDCEPLMNSQFQHLRSINLGSKAKVVLNCAMSSNPCLRKIDDEIRETRSEAQCCVLLTALRSKKDALLAPELNALDPPFRNEEEINDFEEDRPFLWDTA